MVMSEGNRELLLLPVPMSTPPKNLSKCYEFDLKHNNLFIRFCTFCFSTDNKLFENADTAKSRVVQLEIQVAHIQQVRALLVLSIWQPVMI